jgi:hypothetical protein
MDNILFIVFLVIYLVLRFILFIWKRRQLNTDEIILVNLNNLQNTNTWFCIVILISFILFIIYFYFSILNKTIPFLEDYKPDIFNLFNPYFDKNLNDTIANISETKFQEKIKDYHQQLNEIQSQNLNEFQNNSNIFHSKKQILVKNTDEFINISKDLQTVYKQVKNTIEQINKIQNHNIEKITGIYQNNATQINKYVSNMIDIILVNLQNNINIINDGTNSLLQSQLIPALSLVFNSITQKLTDGIGFLQKFNIHLFTTKTEFDNSKDENKYLIPTLEIPHPNIHNPETADYTQTISTKLLNP